VEDAYIEKWTCYAALLYTVAALALVQLPTLCFAWLIFLCDKDHRLRVGECYAFGLGAFLLLVALFGACFERLFHAVKVDDTWKYSPQPPMPEHRLAQEIVHMNDANMGGPCPCFGECPGPIKCLLGVIAVLLSAFLVAAVLWYGVVMVYYIIAFAVDYKRKTLYLRRYPVVNRFIPPASEENKVTVHREDVAPAIELPVPLPVRTLVVPEGNKVTTPAVDLPYEKMNWSRYSVLA
ncbi:Hypothetical protein POVN_LOCUS595, partial [uncultured virus]